MKVSMPRFEYCPLKARTIFQAFSMFPCSPRELQKFSQHRRFVSNIVFLISALLFLKFTMSLVAHVLFIFNRAARFRLTALRQSSDLQTTGVL